MHFHICMSSRPNCRNPYKIDKERASEDDNDDCAEADGDIDLIIITRSPPASSLQSVVSYI